MALDFPASPSNGQVYFDSTSGSEYIFNTSYSAWIYSSSVSPLSNNQIVYVNQGIYSGSNGLTFNVTSNTVFANTVNVSQNVSSFYYFGNGAFLTGVVSDFSPAFNTANAAFNYANGVATNTTAAFAKANAALANTSDVYFAGNLFFPAGNVGIGQTSATYRIDVKGQTRIGYDVAPLSPDTTNIISTAHTILGGNGGNYLTIGQYNISNTYAQWIQSSFSNPTTATYNLILQPAGGNIGIGTATPTYKLHVNGSFAANTKSFVIDHPTKDGMKLRYGSLEGPENGVYVRGKINGKVIELPDYWTGLVYEDSITVQLTAIGLSQNLYIVDIKDNKVYINSENDITPYCFYYIQAERKDVEKLVVEFDA